MKNRGVNMKVFVVVYYKESPFGYKSGLIGVYGKKELATKVLNDYCKLIFDDYRNKLAQYEFSYKEDRFDIKYVGKKKSFSTGCLIVEDTLQMD